LPIPELVFHDWREDRPRVVGYAAKWEDESTDSLSTIRQFISEADEPDLCRRLSSLSAAAWRLFELRGFARVDFRVDQRGNPMILEVNPNPCLEPGSGFAAAAEEVGMSYAEAIERIVAAAL
jgi:D-alanine-D-alanine ligase